eukprot:9232421-Pyramimonas_sp.AAC.1
MSEAVTRSGITDDASIQTAYTSNVVAEESAFIDAMCPICSTMIGIACSRSLAGAGAYLSV